MTDKLTQKDHDLINDEVERYDGCYAKIKSSVQKKARELTDNQEEARHLTSMIVATQRDEEKQALQSDELVAHGLAKLRKNQSDALGALLDQAYFARVVYHENKKDIEFKLGMASFPEQRIIDWRKAPISKLYYDYEEGEDYDDEIAGRDRSGTIKLKRAYRSDGEVLHAIELKDESYVLSRGNWHKQMKLSSQTFSLKDKEKIKDLMQSYEDGKLDQVGEQSGYLHQVLSLLTPEQFRMISTEVSKPVVIQGSAGTGKTTVALHRLAWLMFEGNSKAKEENTLVIMFNNSLAAYVKHVLPELGITKTPIVTFFDWALEIIHTTLGRQLPRKDSKPPEEVASFKTSKSMLRELKKYLVTHPKVDEPDAVLLDFYKTDVLHEFLGEFARHPEVKAYLNKQCRESFFDEYDLALLLHLIHHRDGTYHSKKYPIDLDYLMVDEAQDFTVMELTAIINALEDKTQLTLAGDLGQKILEHRDFGQWQGLLRDLGLNGVEVLSLSVAYRSTYQIYELAETVRNPKVKDEELTLTPKFGPVPKLASCGGFSDAVAWASTWIQEIHSKNPKAIGSIICRTRKEAHQVFDALIKIGTHGIRLGDESHFAFTPGFTVTDVRQVKGLEFRYVLIFNPSEKNYRYSNLQDRNQLYVAITRAEQRLDMVCYDPPSRFIPSFIPVDDLNEVLENEDQPLFSDGDQDLSRFEKDDDEW
jgi:DNA helicase II / ATP-dependent DNA helicase PcrA